VIQASGADLNERILQVGRSRCNMALFRLRVRKFRLTLSSDLCFRTAAHGDPHRGA